MFKHILLPTDGSELSEMAIKQGVRLAKSINAKVTGLCVMPLRQSFLDGTEIPTEVLKQAEENGHKLAASYLAVIGDASKEAGVGCELVYERGDYPYDAIIRLANQKDCDLIMMASHGRKGINALLLGSETQKVLTHSKIPVLVYR